MSLLMKALEKAAKDRGSARAEPAEATAAAPAAPAKAELSLSLEAIPPKAPAAPGAQAPVRTAAEPQRATPVPASAAAPAAARESAQARAATVVQAQSASRPARGGVVSYLRARPMVLFSSLAVLAVVGFGVYVYLQIFNPGLFTAQPPVAARGVPPLTQAPVAPAPPLAAETILKDAATETAPPPDAAPETAARAKPPATPAAAEELSRSTVVVSTGSPEPSLNPRLVQAYGALQAGEIEAAEREYAQLLNAEPASIDVLLGLAAIAVKQGNTEGATRHFLRILELDPRNALAQSGLIALLGRADPLSAESRLRQLIAREPSAHLYFTLGNLYADQSHWAAAQQAYFQAHHLEPANPDYAFNLAVALEHVSQPKLALGFYQRAVQLAGARGRANFNVPQARERIGKLAQQVE